VTHDLGVGIHPGEQGAVGLSPAAEKESLCSEFHQKRIRGTANRRDPEVESSPDPYLPAVCMADASGGLMLRSTVCFC
jgi:hypothetical protein